MSVLPLPDERSAPPTGVADDHAPGENAVSEIWLRMAVSYRMAPSVVFSTVSVKFARPVVASSRSPVFDDVQ